MIQKLFLNLQTIGVFLVKILFIILILLVTLMIFHVTLDYYKPNYWEGYLIDKKEVYHGIFKYGFFAHISTAPFLSVIAIIQVFVLPISKVKIHKFLGRIYVGCILFIAAPGGFVLSFYAFGGLLATLSFLLLSLLWFYFTLKAYLYARNKDIQKHKVYMLRSFTLLSSAIFLRVFSFITSQIFDIHGPGIYTLNSILSWTIPIIVFEVYLMIFKPKLNLE